MGSRKGSRHLSLAKGVNPVKDCTGTKDHDAKHRYLGGGRGGCTEKKGGV